MQLIASSTHSNFLTAQILSITFPKYRIIDHDKSKYLSADPT